ncbi:hypothetical protein PDJAM_G00086320, partial [Pangasius djambal]|nr:hypothetical protein [Pangasius djambal]
MYWDAVLILQDHGATSRTIQGLKCSAGTTDSNESQAHLLRCTEGSLPQDPWDHPGPLDTANPPHYTWAMELTEMCLCLQSQHCSHRLYH